MTYWYSYTFKYEQVDKSHLNDRKYVELHIELYEASETAIFRFKPSSNFLEVNIFCFFAQDRIFELK